MGSKVITYGLVEMFVDLPENARDNKAYTDLDAVSDRLRQRCGQAKKDRIEDVLRILRHGDLEEVDLLVFPGYTLPVGDDPIPQEVLDAIGPRTVVLETFGAGDSKHGGKMSSTRRTHVLRGGKPLLDEPAVQHIATARDADDGERVERVVNELQAARRWGVRGGARCALLVCGEVNVVKHSQESEGRPLHEDLEKCLQGVDLVVNPAHTRTRLPAMHAKRAWLSSGRALLTTANLHGPVRVWQYRKKTSRWRITRSSSQATAQLFIGGAKGRRFDREGMVTELAAEAVPVDGGHHVTVVTREKIVEALHGTRAR